MKALAAPLPVAVTRYPLVAVLLQTQTLWATDASTDGSELVKSTSVSPEIRTRAGTYALMLTLPVEVAPKLPWVDACAASTDPRSSNAAVPFLKVPLIVCPFVHFSPFWIKGTV